MNEMIKLKTELINCLSCLHFLEEEQKISKESENSNKDILATEKSNSEIKKIDMLKLSNNEHIQLSTDSKDECKNLDECNLLAYNENNKKIFVWKTLETPDLYCRMSIMEAILSLKEKIEEVSNKIDN